MEQQGIENAIRDKAREWAAEYGEDFVVELAGDFLSDAAARMERLRQALADGDADTLMLEAHTLKSSSANVGALQLSALCIELETMGRANSTDGAAPKVQALETEFERVKQALAEIIAKEVRP